MERWDKALVRLRKWLRSLPPSRRPLPTCLTSAEAASRLGLTQLEMRREMRRKHMRPMMLDRQQVFSVSRVDDLGRRLSG